MLDKGFSDEVNAAYDKSTIEGGADLTKLKVGNKLVVQCLDCTLTIERREDGLYISGHDKFCPVPTKARIPGSNFGGSMLRMNFVGRGMYMEFHTDEYPKRIITSQVQEVTEVTPE
jgi:hypothetical protein